MSTPSPTPARLIRGLGELRALVGGELGVSAWHAVTQAEVDAFAEATGDRFWLHVDPARAAASPLGGTIAHGLYTLSLGPRLMYELVGWEGIGLPVNYGYDRVRFPAPVPVGSRLRMRLTLDAVREVGGGVEVRQTMTFECEGGEKPACVAELLMRFLPS